MKNNNKKIMLFLLLLLPLLSFGACVPDSVEPCDDTNHSSAADVIVPVAIIAGLGIWYFTSGNKENEDLKLRLNHQRQVPKAFNISLVPLSYREKNKLGLQFSYRF